MLPMVQLVHKLAQAGGLSWGWGSAIGDVGRDVGQARNLDYGLAYRAASPLALAGQLKPRKIRMDLNWFTLS